MKKRRAAYSLRTCPDLRLATKSLIAWSLRKELTSLVKVPSACRFSPALKNTDTDHLICLFYTNGTYESIIKALSYLRYLIFTL